MLRQRVHYNSIDTADFQNSATKAWVIAADISMGEAIEYVYWAKGISLPVLRKIDYGADGFIDETEYLQASQVLGVGELEQKEMTFSIFPNPASGEAFIQLSEYKDCLIEIYDISGKELLKTTLSGPNHRLDVSNWKEGLYYVKLISANGISTQKLMIH